MKKGTEGFNLENLIKGRVAETIVEHLFSSSGYEAHMFGWEHTLPAIVGQLVDVSKNTSTGNMIRCMPDFIMREKEGNRVFFVEAKFSKNGTFRKMGSKYPYKDAYIVVVSTDSIKCATVSELPITADDDYQHIYNHKDFKDKISKENVERCLEIARKFYQ